MHIRKVITVLMLALPAALGCYWLKAGPDGGLDKWNPPACPPENPHCDCIDPARHEGCADNFDKDWKLGHGHDAGEDLGPTTTHVPGD